MSEFKTGDTVRIFFPATEDLAAVTIHGTVENDDLVGPAVFIPGVCTWISLDPTLADRVVTDERIMAGESRPSRSPLDHRMFSSLDESECMDLLKALKALNGLPAGLDGELDFHDCNGDKIARLWWNGERGTWMAEYLGADK